MAIGQVAVIYKTKNKRMSLKPHRTRTFRYTPDETPPYFGSINCIKVNVEIDPLYKTGKMYWVYNDYVCEPNLCAMRCNA
jgi:hypothetical protein